MATRSKVNRLLAEGVASAQAGERERAYNLLMDVIELDRHNEVAWLWLSSVADNLEDQRVCLENVLTINPDNSLAREWLAKLAGDGTQGGSVVICPQCGAGNRDFVRECSACGQAFFHRCPICGEFSQIEAPVCSQCGAAFVSPAPHTGPVSQPTLSDATGAAARIGSPPITIWPVVAFWVSASLFFIGGGMASLVQFAGIVLRARGILHNLKPSQLAWLPMGLFFIAFGLTGVSLAWQLGHRRAGGYYGSLLFGLLLTLLAPGASLVLEPPDYVTTVCTGLMPAAVVLLTLASMAGFE